MKSRLVFTVLLVVMLVSSMVTPLAVAQRPGETEAAAVDAPLALSAEASGPVAPTVPSANPEAVLWDQYANWGSVDFAAQDFEEAYNAYDIFAADDFENTEAWAIDTIVTRGGWGAYVDLNNATAIHWWICPDNGGEPLCDPPGDGNEFWGISLPPSDPQVQLGVVEAEDVYLNLDTPIILPPGTWWLVYQASLEYALYGQYGWSGTTDPVWGSAGMQNNPGGGFGMGAGWWNNTYGYDQMFRLEGEIAPSGCTVFFDDFEEGYDAWSMTGLWNPENEADVCGSLVAPFPSPENSVYYGVDGQCTYNNGATNSGYLSMVFDVDLTTAPTATLEFGSYEQTECGGGNCGFDERFVQVSTDGGGTWQTVWGSPGPEGSWYEASADLDAYVGGPLRIRFYFDTYDSALNDYFGWMVDDVHLKACVGVIDDPVIEVTPESLSAEQCADEVTEQTLQICNVGGAPLTWSISEQPLAGGVTVSLPAGPADAPAGTAVAAGTFEARPESAYAVQGWAGVQAGPDVLLLNADDDNDSGSDIQALLQAYGDLGAVDLFDARIATPTLAELLVYDVVLTWNNYLYADAVAIGNVLADYVDAGGKAIDLMFGLDPSWGYQGRFRTEAYTAMTITSYTFASLCLGSYDPDHPIMAGVTDVCEYYRGTGTTLTAGSSEVAQWADGSLFVAAKDNQTVVTINGYVGYFYQWTGQMPDVVHNAILWLAGAEPPPPDVPWLSADPITGTLPVGQCQDVTVTFDSTGMDPGDYFANLLIDSNDPANPQVVVPVQLVVDSCLGFDAWKEAPEFAAPGETIQYTIVITAEELLDGMVMVDPLPAGVEYAGNLTWNVGDAWYDDVDNTVYWEYSVEPPASAPQPAVDETLGRPAPAIDLPAPLGPLPDGLGVANGTLMILDDFNRDDGPIGPNWTVHDGFCNVSNNAAVCGGMARATFNDAPGDGYVAEADVATVGTSLQYTGLLLNYGAGSTNLFIKVQEQSGTGNFSHAACYYGNNSGSFGLGFFALNEPFSTAHMRATRVGDDVTIEFTDVDGGAKNPQTYVCAGAPPPEGTGIGILGYDALARLDNFGLPGEGPQQAIISFDVTVTAEAGEIILNEGWAGLEGMVKGFSAETEVTGAPVIVVDPLALEVELCPDETETAELEICNVGDAPLQWEIQGVELPTGLIGSVPFFGRTEGPQLPAPSIPAEVFTGVVPEGYVPQAGAEWPAPDGPWQTRASAPFVSMDNVYLDYDGKGYLVSGYGANGQVGIYNPDTDSWTTGATEPTPWIEYPIDGCLGMNADGDPVAVLFNDTTSGATTLHRYNIATNSWDTPPVPAGFPANGLWGHDIASVWRYSGENVCYISGGATTPGGGNTSALYAYYPDTNTAVNLGNFNYLAQGFAFHASWYVPWIGASGGICVGGGVNAGSVVTGDTQCYDIAAGVFNAANADLGPLPAGLWGMADGVLYEDGDYQLWVAQGADAAFALWPNSAYYSQSSGQWHLGPTPPRTGYRAEGTNIAAGDGCSFYVVGGSSGGFTPTNGHERNYSPDCPPVYGPGVPWLIIDPTSGTLLPGECQVVEVTFDATEMEPGEYLANLLISSNDPETPLVTVPVTMTVLAPVEIIEVTYEIDGLEVAFEAIVEGAEPITFAWDFGDGETSDEQNPVHVYAEAGCYEVTLVVSNACALDSWTEEICVEVPCEPVEGVDFEWTPEVGIVGEAIEFTAWVEAGTPPFEYSWDFGDGGSGTGMTITHVYLAAGVYTVTLTVENACSEATVEYLVTVEEGIMQIFLPVVVKNF